MPTVRLIIGDVRDVMSQMIADGDRFDRDHLDGRTVSASTYGNHGCRCAGCRKAWADYMRPRNRAARADPQKEAQRLERTREMRRIGWWT